MTVTSPYQQAVYALRAFQRTHSIKTALSLFAMTACALSLNMPTYAAEPSGTLQQIEALKTDIVELNATFKQLEKEYLYPPSVDAALFVSVDTGQFFKLTNIEARIDNNPVAGHFYTEKQQEALAKGGIQRLQEFQLKPGTYELVITVIGEDTQGNTIKRGVTHTFEKTKQAIGLELQLKDSVKTLGVQLDIKTWQL